MEAITLADSKKNRWHLTREKWYLALLVAPARRCASRAINTIDSWLRYFF